ncbi:hypothetical protein TIFTF001_000216 [Ficus carica]|uniref:Uncharacterized protein n=1 Tax=Ficus carica TaxID=3494 RepID=A0AA87YUW3_FICCA|nr:hypothetical protein TIFTF001_000216 [Ficus carica]
MTAEATAGRCKRKQRYRSSCGSNWMIRSRAGNQIRWLQSRRSKVAREALMRIGLCDGEMVVARVEICYGSAIGAARSRDQSVSHRGDIFPDAVDVKIWSMVTELIQQNI